MKKWASFVLLLLLLLPAAGLVQHGLPSSGEALDTALTERSAFHDALITAWCQALRCTTGETGSAQVIGGQDGFLFFRETASDALGLDLLTDAQVMQIADELCSLSETLRDNGSGLVVLIAPNKATIYPDKLPRYMHSSGAEGSLDRLQTALGERNVRFVDAKDILRKGRENAPVYHKTDTHWNAYGAYLVASALLAECGGPALDTPDFTTDAPMLGDLARLCMPSLTVSETAQTCTLPQSYQTDRPFRSLDAMRIGTRSEGSSLRLVVLRDSFGEALFPYLACTAERLVYLRGHDLDLSVVAQEAPDVVVLELAERSLPLLLAEQ